MKRPLVCLLICVRLLGIRIGEQNRMGWNWLLSRMDPLRLRSVSVSWSSSVSDMLINALSVHFSNLFCSIQRILFLFVFIKRVEHYQLPYESSLIQEVSMEPVQPIPSHIFFSSLNIFIQTAPRSLGQIVAQTSIHLQPLQNVTLTLSCSSAF